MKTIAFICSLSCGVLIWLLLPQMIGRPEPWDGNLMYYILCLAMPSALIGFLFKSSSWLVIAGFFTGQLVMLLQLNASSPSPFIALGIVFLAGFSLVCCGIPTVLVKKLKKQHPESTHKNPK